VRAVLRRMLTADHELQRYAGWVAGEINRNEALSLVQAGRELSQFDATPWAGQLGKPAGALITTADRLVPPRRQRALARALDATVAEVDSDHLAALIKPAPRARNVRRENIGLFMAMPSQISDLEILNRGLNEPGTPAC